jgi:hypothetical protein
MKMTINYFAASAALAGCIAAGHVARSAPVNIESIDLEAIGVIADFEDPDLMGPSSAEQFVRGDLGPGWTALVPDTNENDYGVQDPRVDDYSYNSPAECCVEISWVSVVAAS